METIHLAVTIGQGKMLATVPLKVRLTLIERNAGRKQV
jgi:hypothetical protein